MGEQGSVCIDAIFLLTTVLFIVGFFSLSTGENHAVKEHKQMFSDFLVSFSALFKQINFWC